MKKIFAVAFVIAGITCFAQDAQQKKQAVSIAAENRKIATTLPAKVIDPPEGARFKPTVGFMLF